MVLNDGPGGVRVRLDPLARSQGFHLRPTAPLGHAPVLLDLVVLLAAGLDLGQNLRVR